MKLIECKGKPLEMGQQYGEQAKEEIRRNLELRGKSLSYENSSMDAGRINNVLKQLLPDVLDELEGIAKSSGVKLSSLLLANHMNISDTNADRCTPVLLRNSPEGTIVAKNNDALPAEDYPFIIRRCAPDKGLPFIHITYAGWLCGLDAINSEGLADSHGSVGSVFSKTGNRIDIRLQAYSLMKTCRTSEEFIQELSKAPITGKGYSIAIGDAGEDTAIIDAALPYIAVRNRFEQFAYSTNLYMAPGFENADTRPLEQRDICTYRNGYLRWVAESKPPENLADIKSLLSSHDPWAPCRHEGPHASKTVWSMICLTQERLLLLADGNPCRNDYIEFTI